jgi:hypothetical protein
MPTRPCSRPAAPAPNAYARSAAAAAAWQLRCSHTRHQRLPVLLLLRLAVRTQHHMHAVHPAAGPNMPRSPPVNSSRTRRTCCYCVLCQNQRAWWPPTPRCGHTSAIPSHSLLLDLLCPAASVCVPPTLSIIRPPIDQVVGQSTLHTCSRFVTTLLCRTCFCSAPCHGQCAWCVPALEVCTQQHVERAGPCC